MLLRLRSNSAAGSAAAIPQTRSDPMERRSRARQGQGTPRWIGQSGRRRYALSSWRVVLHGTYTVRGAGSVDGDGTDAEEPENRESLSEPNPNRHGVAADLDSALVTGTSEI